MKRWGQGLILCHILWVSLEASGASSFYVGIGGGYERVRYAADTTYLWEECLIKRGDPRLVFHAKGNASPSMGKSMGNMWGYVGYQKDLTQAWYGRFEVRAMLVPTNQSKTLSYQAHFRDIFFGLPVTVTNAIREDMRLQIQIGSLFSVGKHLSEQWGAYITVGPLFNRYADRSTFYDEDNDADVGEKKSRWRVGLRAGLGIDYWVSSTWRVALEGAYTWQKPMDMTYRVEEDTRYHRLKVRPQSWQVLMTLSYHIPSM